MKMTNKINRLLIAAFAVISGGLLQAQQDAMYSQYFWNPLSVNSGYAGSRDALNVTLLAREQWVSIEGAPSTQTLSIHSPLRNDKVALGLSVINDKIGPTATTQLTGDFAYRINVTENTRLALGLKAGVNLFKAGLTGVENTGGDDIAFMQDIATKPLPNFGFGAYLFNERYFVGLSAPKLLENKLYENANTQEISKEFRHFFAMAGYVFDISPSVKFKPTVLTKYVAGAPVSIDLTANVLLDEKLWLGVMYRVEDAVGLLASYQFTDQFRVGYAYDYTLSELTDYNSGSHELMLSYDFIFRKDKTLSPRYF